MLKTISLIGLILYFLLLLIVVLKEKKNDTIEDYFFAGRKLPFWALSITFIASWWGAGSALSTADLAYNDGLGAFWYYGVPVLISTFLMIVFSRAIRKVGYYTQGQIMESRYSKTVGRFLSIFIFLFMTLNASSQMVGIGMFFGTYMGFRYEVAVFIGTFIVLIYSIFGGFRGVVFTDIFQFCLLLFSATAVFVVAFSQSGGFSAISEQALKLGKVDFMSFKDGASKYMMYVITFGCAWMIQANVWQRISATKNPNDAKKMTIMSFFVYIPLYLIVVFTGMAGLVLYPKLPSGGIITAVVTDYMNPVLGAVVFVGISAAIMSTMDSLINTGALTLTVDLGIKQVSVEKSLNFSRFATLVVTGIAFIIAIRIRSILEISWIASDIITTGVFVPLLLGFIWRRGNSKGALASMIAGLFYSLYNLCISLGFSFPTFWEVHSVNQVILGILLSFIMYVGVSLVTKPEYDRADSFINKAKK